MVNQKVAHLLGFPLEHEMALITDQILTSAVTTITILGLDLDAHGAYLLYLSPRNQQGSNSSIYIYFNNDTTLTNYYFQYLLAIGGSRSSNRLNQSFIGHVNANSVSFTEAIIMANPVDTRWHARIGRRPASSIELELVSGAWVSSVNVTRIDITASVANALGIGTRIMLFKVLP